MVNKEVRKIDSEAIVTGKPIYTEDLIFHKDVLTIKLLRSPHAFAKIKNIDTKNALKVKGVVNIFTYKDVPNYRYSMVGESYPEASPHDQLILEDVVRYVGDEVAIIAAEDERAAIKAMKLIKVEYEVMTPILETVALLSKLDVDKHIDVEIKLDELDLTSAESKATYAQIKEYVLEKFGLKVSTLYIAQIKKKCGIELREHYNKSKKDNQAIPQCTPEKEEAIMDALRHFKMI